MALNHEFNRHIQAALEKEDQRAATVFEYLRKTFNALKVSGAIFELPKEIYAEDEYIDLETIEPQEMDLLLLGKVLRQRPLELGLSQQDFKQRLGLHREYISMLENARRRPSKKNLGRLSDNLQFPQPIQNKLFKLAGYTLASQVFDPEAQTRRGETLQS